jgi:hypothetical protein
MPTLEYFIVCRSVSIDIDTDEVSLSNVLEDLFLDEDGKALLPRIVAISAWNLDDSELSTDFQTILAIRRPGESKSKDFPMNLSHGRKRHRAMATIVDIPLDNSGELLFQVLLNGTHQASHKVFVHPQGVKISSVNSKLLN